MKHPQTVLLTALVLTLISGRIHGVATRYINDLRFDNLDNIDASNVCFSENGGVELAKPYEVIFSSQDILWDVQTWKNGFLCTAGDIATLLFAEGKKQTPVFSSSNHVLFSDIEVVKDHIYLSALPKAAVFRLDGGFRKVSEITLSNEYAWQLIPYNDGLILLAGNPAAVYFLDDDNRVSLLASVPTEDNLIKGFVSKDSLYFIGDGNTLYRMDLAGKKNKKITAIASFDTPLADILLKNGLIYAITAPKDGSRSLSGTSSGSDEEGSRSPSQEKRSSRSTGGHSSLYSIRPDGSTEELFVRSNIRFLSLSAVGDSLVIGIDRNAGYFEIPLVRDTRRKFSGLGKGKFARFVSSGKNLYGVLLEPSRIVKIGEGYSSGGYLISSPIDTGNVSAWGEAECSTDLLPGTDVKVFSRTGAVLNEDLWEDWSPVGKKIASSPNRYFQYRIELLSTDGKNSPVFRGITVPFVQKNIAPKIEKISVGMNNPGVLKIAWDASDENKDALTYDVFIAKTENEWIPLNEKPLEDASVEIQASQLPDGKYRLKITASDEKSNPPSLGKTSYLVSEPFLVDNTPPELSELKISPENGETIVRFSAADASSELADASYSINGSKWVKFLPVKGIFDSRQDQFELRLRNAVPYSLQVRVSDGFGNFSVKGAVIRK